jgi:hypothetical protein
MTPLFNLKVPPASTSYPSLADPKPTTSHWEVSNVEQWIPSVEQLIV